MTPRLIVAGLLALFAATASAQLAPPPQGEVINLAARAHGGRVVLSSTEGSGQGTADRLIDGQVGDQPYATETGSPLPQDIVLAFYKDEVATVQAVVFNPSSKAPKDTWVQDVEVLVSLTSPVANFVSLGTFTLAQEGKPQVFPVIGLKAKFVKVRLFSNHGARSATLGEIEVQGVLPKEPEFFITEIDKEQLSHFKNMGRDALVFVEYDPSERKMVQDARDGTFDEHSLEEAALIASGVFDAKKRQDHIDRIRRLQEGARKASFGAKTDRERGRLVFEWLHAEFFDHYQSGATDFDKMLDSRIFNCVSSTTLYNVVGLAAGLKMAAIELPDHVFSLLHADGEAIDAETTSPHGFFRIRDPAQFERFKNESGLQYNPDPKSKHRREVGSVGLVAIIYSNRAVDFMNKKEWWRAVVCLSKALEMDPGFASALHALIGAYNGWGIDELNGKSFERAAAVFREGLKIDPYHFALDANRIVAFNNWCADRVKAGKFEEAVQVCERGLEQCPGNPYLTQNRSLAYRAWAAALLGEGKPERALAVLDEGAARTGDAALATEGKAWALNDWAMQLVEKGEFRAALEAMMRAVAAHPKDRRLAQNRSWVVFRWVESLDKAGKRAEAVKVLEEAMKLDPKERNFRKQRAWFCAKAAEERLTSGDLMGAADYFAQAAEADPDDRELAAARTALFNNAAIDGVKGGQFERAIAMLNLGISLDPRDRKLQTNRAWAYSEWAKAAAAKDGAAVGAKLLRAAVEKHAGDGDVRKVWTGYVNAHGVELLEQRKDFAAALAWWEDALRAAPEERSFRNNRNVVYFKQAEECAGRKDWAGAIAVMERAVEADPQERKFKDNLKYYRAQAEGK